MQLSNQVVLYSVSEIGLSWMGIDPITAPQYIRPRVLRKEWFGSLSIIISSIVSTKAI